MNELQEVKAIVKTSKPMRVSRAKTLTREKARAIVDWYISVQKLRIGTSNKQFALEEGGDYVPNADVESLLSDMKSGLEVLEKGVVPELEAFARQYVAGQWALSMTGVGPIIAAGLLAHIDPERATSAGAVWRFAGLDPSVKWGKGQRRPWNAALKVLCWKLGESFKKVSGRPDSLYGRLYRQRKEFEVQMSESGQRKETAAAALAEKTYSKSTAAYAAYIKGELPAGRMDLRATRYAVKIFLSHFQAVMYEDHFHKPAPIPWVIQFGGHKDTIAIPNWPMEKP